MKKFFSFLSYLLDCFKDLRGVYPTLTKVLNIERNVTQEASDEPDWETGEQEKSQPYVA